MKKTILILITAFFTTVCFGQNFEGKIVYQNVYKSKIPGMTDEQLTSTMGSTQEYYIKEGDYKSVMNGSLMQWQLYVNKDQKLYNKMSNSESIFWNDATENTDEVLKTEINKAVTTVLGYTCNELILTCKSGIQKYYFNSKFPVNVKLFLSHKYGNWYEFLSRANALPLKSIVENAQLSFESTATEIKPMKLDKTFFDLPAGSKTMKSPY